MTHGRKDGGTARVIWPPLDGGLAGEPDEPVLRAVYQALQPLRPLMRLLTFTPAKGGSVGPSVLIGLGAEAYAIGILVYHEDTLLVDIPVGEVICTADTMHSLLSFNLSRDWPFRVDQLSGDVEPRALVVIERRLPLTSLDQLPGLVLEGWYEKRMADGTVHFLNGERELL